MAPASLRTLLTGIIDYAGLFPPAQLPLDQALRNFARYRTEPEAWMLGRFVCPAGRFDESAALGQELFIGAPWAFTVLGRGGKDAKEFFDNVRLDLADIQRFVQTWSDRVVVDAYEVKLPGSAFQPIKKNQLASLVGTTAYLIETSGPPSLLPVFESPVTDPAAHLAVIQALHDDRHTLDAAKRQRCRQPGYKVRTGGVEASAFPSAHSLALVISACHAAGVPFKATAGLHHPLRRFDAGLQTWMHGFFNVFGGACLAARHSLKETDLVNILMDEKPDSWHWEEDKARWKNLAVSTQEIAGFRQSLALSFGSCSFDEPREDLRALNWI